MTSEETLSVAESVIERCRRIATYTETPGETFRPFLCESARQVQVLVEEWMELAGMTARLDNAGNLRGLYAGSDAHSSRLLLGSHLDTVPNAGAFDGILGVVLAIAMIEELRDERFSFAIEVIAFSEEEGVRFRRPFLGSMALTGRMDWDVLNLRDASGMTVGSALAGFGLDPSRLHEAAARPDAIGFLEVHIEQGPVLDEEHLELGVVEGIVGQTRLLVTFTGHSNHAGTTPMMQRHDPVAAAAEWISAVEARAKATDGLVATVGHLEVRPGAANVIAAEVMASLDVRHATDAVRAATVHALVDLAETSGRRREVEVRVETTLDQAAVPMSGAMTETLERAAMQAGYAPRRMTSGAGHDAMVLAERMPSAMLFVRSPGGLSHHPEESVRTEDVTAALATMINFLRLLDDQVRSERHQ